MGSVISDCVCPKCNYKYAHHDYYYKSDEVYVFCSRCGYHYNRTLKVDSDNKILPDINGKLQYDEEEGGGFGRYTYTGRKGIGTLGGLPDGEDIIKNFIKDVKKIPNLEAYYTIKEGDIWFEINVNNGTKKELKDDEDV